MKKILQNASKIDITKRTITPSKIYQDINEEFKKLYGSDFHRVKITRNQNHHQVSRLDDTLLYCKDIYLSSSSTSTSSSGDTIVSNQDLGLGIADQNDNFNLWSSG